MLVIIAIVGWTLSSLKQATCPSCNSTLRFKPKQAGLIAVKCPNCGTSFKVRGRDFAELAAGLDEISRRWPHLMWRIDFNEVLSKSEGAVKGLQHRALVNLRKNLMDSGTTDD